jgi:hypothetical protein
MSAKQSRQLLHGRFRPMRIHRAPVSAGSSSIERRFATRFYFSTFSSYFSDLFFNFLPALITEWGYGVLQNRLLGQGDPIPLSCLARKAGCPPAPDFVNYARSPSGAGEFHNPPYATLSSAGSGMNLPSRRRRRIAVRARQALRLSFRHTTQLPSLA